MNRLRKIKRLNKKRLTLYSPAKLNLFLRVLKRRTDGYHDLGMICQTISLCDILTFSIAPKKADILYFDKYNDIDIPLNGRNLIIKAFEVFRNKTGIQTHFCVKILKQIPVEGGFGGGSSNGATALYAANKLCGSPVPENILAIWAGAIGSDVTFFFSNGLAYCSEKGQRMKNIDKRISIPRNKQLWLIKPEQGCSTKMVFDKLGLSKGQNFLGPDPDILRDEMVENGMQSMLCINDLEIPANQLVPEISNIKQILLDSGFETISMTGAGSAYFAIGDNHNKLTTEQFTDLKAELKWIKGNITFVHRTNGQWYNCY